MRLAERAALLASAAAAGTPLPPINFVNPGAFGQVSFVNEAVISALPPPPRPLWPISPAQATARVARGVSFSLLIAGLALYLYAKDALSAPGARARLESNYPKLSALFSRCGFVDDLSALEAGGAEELDVRALGGRVWDKFAPNNDMTGARAQRLLTAACHAADGDLEAAAAGIDVAPATALMVDRKTFIESFEKATQAFPRGSIFLGVSDGLGVRGASPAVLEALGGLFDKVVAARLGRGAAFSPAALAALAAQVGWAADEAHSASWLVDCSDAIRVGAPNVPTDVAQLAALGARRGPLTGTATGAAAESAKPPAPPTTQMPWSPVMRRSEFVDYMLLAAAGAGVTSAERIIDYVRVWEMLNRIRETAGVKPA